MSSLINAAIGVLTNHNLSSHLGIPPVRHATLLALSFFIATWVTPSFYLAYGQSVQRSVVHDGVAFDIPVTAVCYPLPDNTPRSFQNTPVDTAPVSTLEPADLAANLTNNSYHLVSADTSNNLPKHKPATASNSAQHNPAVRQYAARPSLAEQYRVASVARKNRYLLPIDATVVFSDPAMIETVIFEIFPLSRTWRIDDYAPRSISTTDYVGPISEETKKDSSQGIAGDLKGGIPGYADLSLKINGGNSSNTLTRQTIKPPHNQIVTSGLTQRGTGVFFKFHRSTEFAIEGGHQLELLLEVDQQWRGDVVQIHCRALDQQGNMFTKDFLMAITIDGDWQSADIAQRFAAADRSFQNVLRRWQVKKRPSNFLSGINAAFGNDKEPAKPDSVALARGVFAAKSPNQIPGINQLPGSVKSSVVDMVAAKVEMLRLAQ